MGIPDWLATQASTPMVKSNAERSGIASITVAAVLALLAPAFGDTISCGGVHVGDTMAAVKRIYPALKPYSDLGLECNRDLRVMFHHGRVCALVLTSPRYHTHGISVSESSLEVKKTLGLPTRIFNFTYDSNEPRTRWWFYDKLGLTVTLQNTKNRWLVTEINIHPVQYLEGCEVGG